MKRHRLVLGLLLALPALIPACGGDAAGPGGGPASGVWYLDFPLLTAGCSISEIQVVLYQTGTAMNGSYTSQGQVSCVYNNATHAIAVGQGSVLGSLNGLGIDFTLTELGLQVAGTLSNGAMGGAFHLQVVLPGTPAGARNIGGNWTALPTPAP